MAETAVHDAASLLLFPTRRAGSAVRRAGVRDPNPAADLRQPRARATVIGYNALAPAPARAVPARLIRHEGCD